ncbi:MAG: glutamate synthase large subunit [Verrucomicrobiales bacterium]|nr:glutamate synthase large subunit [Verrucomicrobiales bacterium]
MTSYLHIPAESHGSLHRPELERDSCGVGVVAHIRGERSRRILDLGLTSVCNVTHRGALNADKKTGDGAGVMTHLPYALLLPEAERLGTKLDRPEDLAVGVFFLPVHGSAENLKARILAEGVLRNRGVGVIGWRLVPVDSSALGDQALDTEPEIQHLLLKRPAGMDDATFERTLFLARREIEIRATEEEISGFYIPSLSHSQIVYKGFMVASALPKYFIDLNNPAYETGICLYHQRFSTNTFPTWALSHPFRMLAHNGEINTLRGNRNWLNSRIAQFESPLWADHMPLLRNLFDPKASDSASLDQALELLVLSGRSVPHAMAMLVPPAWRIDPFTPQSVADFYKYHSCFCEPWDGPAALAFTDGKTVAACLDRNGLRPARYKVTDDGIFSLGSEVGTCHLPDETVVEKGRLGPGEMIVVDTDRGELLRDREIKQRLADQQPYGQWLAENRISFNDRVSPNPPAPADDLDSLTLSQHQVTHDYNQEEMDMILSPMIKTGQEAIYSMGDDAALSVLSLKPKVLFTYFKQLFAQVTNPPIDPIREHLVMSVEADIGPERNLLTETPEHAQVIHLESPFLFEHQLRALESLDPDFPPQTIDMTWAVSEGTAGLAPAIDRLCREAEQAVDNGAKILILSDRATDHARAPIPSLLAVGAVHHHLTRSQKRMKTSLIIETGEARDVHHMACLIGFGVTAICPYLAHQSVRELLETDKKGNFAGIDLPKALIQYHKALEKGLLKIMSKMGISVLNSYQGAQIFEAVGIGDAVVAKCFAGTPSQIGGIGFAEIAAETLQRHTAAWGQAVPGGADESAHESLKLDDPGYLRPRRGGEVHAVSGPVIKNFHTFVKTGSPEDYQAYLEEWKKNRPNALHDLFELVPAASGPIPIDEVEPIEDIRRRFTTAAMSLGALSPEAHETLAIAMNRIGGKSDSGEGGEDSVRFKPYPNGDWANSKIKQVASGRFGVHAEYLMSAEEIEIKMAQGAKPGEGGQLPGHKVDALIARLRHTQPGITLISPPPHHDIYSIEDLAQLIHDLKEINPRAKVCVKLVAETGVGTIAAGVAKASADVILVSGHDGGTGASPISSIKHAGLPWEIGIAETQQVLMLNGLRERVTLRTDGGLRTGIDIIHAAALGAEEYNFGTIALIAMGCVYVRQCHLNTCPVGIATQDPARREKFKGTPEMVVNFFNSVSQEVREHLAALGLRKLDDLIGRPEFLRQREVPGHPKANLIDLSRLLRDVAKESKRSLARIRLQDRNDGLHAAPLDDKIIQDARNSIRDKEPIKLSYKVKNTNRNVGTKLSGVVADHHGNNGLPEGTIDIALEGSAGQSFGTFLCGGIRLTLTGEANDYVGKGMCGGEIVLKAPAKRKFAPHLNSIAGNTVMYGATGGRLFANGRAGERFAVRNSGGTAVVEGIGDHGCEYMTNGFVVILGSTGRNFGAGMSGGLAFVLDLDDRFEKLYNPEMVQVSPLDDPEDIHAVQHLISQHAERTDSEHARAILADWETHRAKFRKVHPKTDLADPKAAAAAPATAAAKAEAK